ncbi:MAG: molybdenum cofactor biosynthesis protein MoaE [Planctomycetota bacterium]
MPADGDRAARLQVTLVEDEIDVAASLDAVRDVTAGAVVLFLGTVREVTGEDRTVRLEYEAYRPMAVAEMERLAAEASARWGLVGVCLSHRVGTLGPGEVAVAVAASAGHRDEAFAGGRWLIDTLKERVPIWKKEHFADGWLEWIHAGPDAGADQ